MEVRKETEGFKTSPAASEEATPPEEREVAEGSSKQADEDSEAYRKLLAEKQDLYDRLLRKQAEIENTRKRVQREKEEFLQHANAELIRSLLPALDGFDRALKRRDPSVPEQFYQGMELVHKQLLDALARAGLNSVEAQGKIFDPEVHQAIETVEAEKHHREREVVEEFQRGYKLKHRLLRPAVVKVAVHAQPHAKESSSDPSVDSK